MLKRYHTKGIQEAGVDEAGRGCLAGPVTAAAVILHPDKRYKWYSKLDDSKKLTHEVRNELRYYIEENSIAWSVGFADHKEIDTINILNATYLAMHRAITGLHTQPSALLIDGNRFKSSTAIPHQCIIKGDGIYLAIAAASILAKTHRDEYMLQLHNDHPQYGWDQNKAYATAFHRNAIDQHGLTAYHRLSFHNPYKQLALELEDVG